MHKYFLFFFVLTFHTVIFCQQHIPARDPHDSTYFIAVEEMPEPIGGISAIRSNLHYTLEAKLMEVEGKIYVLAYINELGSVDSTKILKGLGYGLDEIASEAVLKTRFIPGRQDGVPVKIEVAIPIVFKLEKNQIQ